MLIHEIMTEPVHTCTAEMNLAAASRRMRETGSGTLVVLWHGRLAGIVTDRDLALAIGTSRDPGLVTVEEIMTRPVRTCRSSDDVRTAFDVMTRFKVRRLPVVGLSGDVDGMISVDDIILWAVPAAALEVKDLIAGLRSVCARSTAAVRNASQV